MAHITNTTDDPVAATVKVIEVMKLDLGPNDKLLIRCGFEPRTARYFLDALEMALPDLAGRMLVIPATAEPMVVRAEEER